MSEKYERVSPTSEFCLPSCPCCVENYFSLLDWFYKLLLQKLPAKEQDQYCRAWRRNSLFVIWFVFFFLYLFKLTLFSKCMHWSREEWNFFPSFKHCNANSAPFSPLHCDVLSMYTRGEVYVITPQHSFYHSNENFKFGGHLRNGKWIQMVRRYCGSQKFLCYVLWIQESTVLNKTGSSTFPCTITWLAMGERC